LAASLLRNSDRTVELHIAKENELIKLLITGASSFIGRNLAKQLQYKCDVAMPARRELDLTDDGAVRRFLESHLFDVVIHCATVRSNRRIGEPLGLLRDNCRMFFNLARNSAQFGKMIYFGSGAEYDRRFYQPRMCEEYFDAHVPVDDYGFSKYVCANAVPLFPNVYELRLFGVFGPYEDWTVRFISNACCRALWDLPVLLRQEANFDYLDVRDLGLIVKWVIENNPKYHHYNACSGRAWPLSNLASMVVAASGKTLDILVKQGGFCKEYSGDNTRLLAEMEGIRFRDMDKSIRDLYTWYVERKKSINPKLLSFDE
jgi:UDP-glucose 4-epimerase